MEKRVWHSLYDKGIPTSYEFKDVSLPQLLERSATKHGDSTALIFMNGHLSYRQLKQDVDRLATALATLGVGRDTRVAIQLPNLPQTVIAYYATLALGAQVVMTNPMYVEREIEHQWNDAGCTVAVVTDFLFERRIKAIRQKLPVKNYLIASIPEYLRFPFKLLAPLTLRRADPPLMAKVDTEEGIYFFRQLIKATPPRPPEVLIGADDIAVVQYTGGTTGVSKGAMLTHGNLLGANYYSSCRW